MALWTEGLTYHSRKLVAVPSGYGGGSALAHSPTDMSWQMTQIFRTLRRNKGFKTKKQPPQEQQQRQGQRQRTVPKLPKI